MYGRIVLGIDGAPFDEPFEKAKATAGVTTDAEVPADDAGGAVRPSTRPS